MDADPGSLAYHLGGMGQATYSLWPSVFSLVNPAYQLHLLQSVDVGLREIIHVKC